MSAEEEKIRQGFKKLNQQNERVFNATVIAVDEDKCTIDIKTAGGSELYNVKLKALENQKRGFLIIPKNNSDVQVCEIGERDFLMISADEVEKLILIIDTVKYEIDKDGFVFQKGNDTLWIGIKLLIESIEAIIVLQGTNPDRAKLAMAKTKLKNILNGS